MTAPTREKTRPEELAVGEPIPADRFMLTRREPVELANPDEIATYIRQRDDEQIMAQLMGEMISEWFYEFSVGGKQVEGISVVGAMEFARLRAEAGFPIRFPAGSIVAEEVELRGERGIRCTVIARDARTGAEGVGQAFYPWYAPRRNGPPALDDKADRKALSVAKRNAVLDLVPEAQIKAMLRERKRLIAENEKRQLSEVKAATQHRVDNAPPAKRISAKANLAPRDAYESASEEQIQTLLDLAADERVPQEVRDKVEAQVASGITGKKADEWIAKIRANVEQAPGDAGGELPLGDKSRETKGTAIRD